MSFWHWRNCHGIGEPIVLTLFFMEKCWFCSEICFESKISQWFLREYLYYNIEGDKGTQKMNWKLEIIRHKTFVITMYWLKLFAHSIFVPPYLNRKCTNNLLPEFPEQTFAFQLFECTIWREWIKLKAKVTSKIYQKVNIKVKVKIKE